MSSISALSSTSAAWATAQTQRPSGPPPGGGGPEKTNAAVADLLGIDADTLKTQLAGGKTMSELAEAAGVDEDDLVATIQATLPTDAPSAMATDIASGKIGPGGPAGGPPPKPPVDAQSGIQALSDAFGISSDDLLARLTDGTGIQDLLDANPQVAAQLSSNQSRGALVDGYA
ncbi:hypothetical protein SAMN05660199_04323 [Klenkia soli]|uniref:Uncharacterized protein n=1 Tax=Klenkia soli TaxID=1052260 RepID=A0A1H0U0C4_9ACTN|nr:hypothetical protein [Klenkia soli]SDP59266.1 hypothetical protein SAMN05660199_04323 [Klenkia soli]